MPYADSFISDSPPSAGDDGSDYEAPAYIKYATQRRTRGRAKPRFALRSQRPSQSRISLHLEDDDSVDLKDAAVLDDVDEESDSDDACTLPHARTSLRSLLFHTAFRSSGRRDRPGRTQIDHDVFEGLPIRQWKQIDAPGGPPPVIQPITGKNSPRPELPMPRDWQMLPEVSQQLLRAARAGKLYKPPTPPDDEEEEKPDDDAEGPVKEAPKGFMTRKWSQIPKHLEAPEREYLAKRRKGLSNAYATGAVQQVQPAGATRMTKVRRTDADGNSIIYEVQAIEGQSVEGEIGEEAVATEAAPVVATVAPGTVIEGVGVANAEGLVVAATEGSQPTPSRRKPPPPRRKKKGPSRGHKKVMIAAPGMEGIVYAQNGAGNGNSLAVLADGTTPAEGDTPMPDAQDGDEEDSGEEGEEGDEGDEEDGSEEGELAQTLTPGSGTPVQHLPSELLSAPTSGTTSAPALPPLDSVPEPGPAVPTEPAASPLSPPPTDAATAPSESPLAPVNVAEAQHLEPIDTSAGPNVDKERQRDRSSSLDEPLVSANSHSRHGSVGQAAAPAPALPPIAPTEEAPKSGGEVDLFGSLEKHLEGQEPGKPEELERPDEIEKPEELERPVVPEKPEELEKPAESETLDDAERPEA